jgi:hypothetical protein
MAARKKISEAPAGENSSLAGTEKIAISGSQYTLVSTIASYFRTLTQTLTNKTVSLTANTLTGTTVQFNTALSDGDFATLAGSETLTNKTLTTPTIASYTNATHNHTNAAGGGTLAETSFVFTDITTRNATSAAHGLLPKLSNISTQFLNGQGGWTTPAGAVATDTIFDAKGDLAVGTGSNTASRLPAGTNGYILSANSTAATGLEWIANTGGSGDVATDTIWDAKGDIVGGTGSNTAARLPAGTNGQVLTIDLAETTGLKWTTPGAGTNVSTDTLWDVKGDLAVGTGSNTASRLPAGTNGYILSANSTAATGLEWVANSGSGGLTSTSIAPSTAAVTAVVGMRYFADVSGLTADRNFVLPTCSAGDEIEIKITTGDDTYEFIVIGDTGVSIEGGSTATEWSRLFISGETVHFVASAADTWRVTYDGRIPCEGSMALTADEPSTNSGSTDTLPTWDTAVINQGDVCDTTNYRFNVRRAGRYMIGGSGQSSASLASAEVYYITLKVNGTTIMNYVTRAPGSNQGIVSTGSMPVICAVGDAVYLYYLSGSANRGMRSLTASFWIKEI